MRNTPRRIESLKNQRKIQYQNPNEKYITKTSRKSVFVKFPTEKCITQNTKEKCITQNTKEKKYD